MKTTAIVSTSVLAFMLGFTPAYAADMGGDCCADLEERVSELEATTVRKGNRKVSVKLSGHVNEMVMYWDDGVESDIYVVNNHQSRTRFRLTGSAKITNHLSAGYKQEFFIDDDSSARVTQRNDDGGRGGGDSGFVAVKHFWYIKHNKLGQLSVGRNSPATDDITRIDLGGANGIAGAESQNVGGSLFLTRGNANATGGSQARNIIVPIDISRAEVVRYDSPNIAGFKLTAAWGEDDIWDIGLRFAGEFSGIRVAAGVGYYETTDNRGQSNVGGAPNDDSEGDDRFLGSISVWDAANTGLYSTGFWNFGTDGGQNGGVQDADEMSWGIRGGIRKKFIGLGKTNLWVDYRKSEVDNRRITFSTAAGNAVFFGDHEGEQWGVGVVQDIDAAAMSLYARYKHWSFDVRNDATGANANVNDMQIFFAGGIIKF